MKVRYPQLKRLDCIWKVTERVQKYEKHKTSHQCIKSRENLLLSVTKTRNRKVFVKDLSNFLVRFSSFVPTCGYTFGFLTCSLVVVGSIVLLQLISVTNNSIESNQVDMMTLKVQVQVHSFLFDSLSFRIIHIEHELSPPQHNKPVLWVRRKSERR